LSNKIMVAREKRAITNYYIIKPHLQQKNVSDFNPTVVNSILHCENENLIKADWLTMWVLEMFHPIPISLAESDSDR
jgi:hypothetical protein